ncbi:hypothetical protein BGX34_005368 [Mortierella sp. NVP85]|nr:hypothetical protein BGX34_005368 [Mortierella sp. NVP85]
MPALSDKIFLPISIFVLNVVLAIFKFILISAVGACFAIYAKYGGEYAKSVGWIRSAGYLEMVKSFQSISRSKNVPGSVKWALIVGLFATLVASFLDKGISAFVEPATRPEPSGKNVSEIRQFLTSSEDHKMFVGWNTIVPRHGNVEDTMKTALINANPSPEKNMAYFPTLSEYSVTCADFGVKLEARAIPRQFVKTERSPNHWSIIMAASSPVSKGYTLMGTLLEASFGIQSPISPGKISSSSCILEEDYRPRRRVVDQGVIAFPRTSTTKCFHTNGDVTVISMTTTRFTHHGDKYRPELASTFLDKGSDELLPAMKETANVLKMPSTPGQLPQNTTDIEMWIELRASGSNIDMYACGSASPQDETAFVMSGTECLYGTITMRQFRPNFNNGILSNYTHREHATYMTLEYSENRIDGTVSIEKMKNDTTTVTDYMRKLGYNFHADFDNATLYIQYDVARVKSGLEVPLWVLVVSGIILITGVLVWQLTTWLVGSPYSSSLYRIIYARLASGPNTRISRVMRFHFEPLMFEDTELLPDLVERLSEDTEFLPDQVERLSKDTELLPDQVERLPEEAKLPPVDLKKQ